MPQIKVIHQETQTNAAVSTPTNGTSVSLSGALTVAMQVVVTNASTPGTASAILQVSNDASDITPTNWNDYGSSQSISTNGTLFFEKANPSGNWIRVKFAIASGSFDASTTFVVKGPN